MKKPTIEVGDREKLKGKKCEAPFGKVKKASTFKKGAVEKSELPNLGDESLSMKANCDVDYCHVLLAKCDDDGD